MNRIFLFPCSVILAMGVSCNRDAGTPDETVPQDQPAVEDPVDTSEVEPEPAKCELPLLAVAEKIQAMKFEYPSNDRPEVPKDQDCSGIFRKALDEFENTCKFEKPDETARSAAQLADWYESKGLFTEITDPIGQSSLIVPGAAMFYSRQGRIFHVGYVVDVKKDDQGVVSYRLMHGQRPGKLAGITDKFHRDPDSVFRSANGKVKPFANWHDPWTGVASIM